MEFKKNASKNWKLSRFQQFFRAIWGFSTTSLCTSILYIAVTYHTQYFESHWPQVLALWKRPLTMHWIPAPRCCLAADLWAVGRGSETYWYRNIATFRASNCNRFHDVVDYFASKFSRTRLLYFIITNYNETEPCKNLEGEWQPLKLTQFEGLIWL